MPATSVCCFAVTLNASHASTHVVELVPIPSEGVYQHMTIVKCKQPGVMKESGGTGVWECGARLDGNRQKGMQQAAECEDVSTEEIVYYYQGGREELQGLKFPAGVGSLVGGSTDWDYLVLITHYPSLENLTSGYTGESGVKMRLVTGQNMKLTGDISFGTYGLIDANRVGVTEGSFTLDEPVVVHPLFASAHTHDLAIAANLWLQTAEGTQVDILRQTANQPVRYFPALDPHAVLRKGDKFAFSCTFNNTLPIVLRVRYVCFSNLDA